MDNFKLFERRAFYLTGSLTSLLIVAIFAGLLIGGVAVSPLLAATFITSLFIGFIMANYISSKLSQPLEVIWQDIVYLADDKEKTTAPKEVEIKIARELLASVLPQLRSLSEIKKSPTDKPDQSGTVKDSVDTLPLPFLVVDEQSNIIYSNESAADYLGYKDENLAERNLDELIGLDFQGEPTYEEWVELSSKRVNNTKTWIRVRVSSPNGVLLHQADMSSYYSKTSEDKGLVTIVFMDRTEEYNRDDQGIGYVAMAVHELRTPLTIMRGYIEVFQSELKGKLDPEMADFLKKLAASAQQLGAFVSNILNVARIEENQLTLHLSEQKWADLLHNVCDELEVRAQVNGRHFEYNVHAGLPTVGVDRVSIHEVLNNLLDNAIKYSGQGKRIIISSRLNKEGMVETTIQDFGIGIPNNVLPHLFDKFYRSHRSRDDISGTGLGLYLSRALIEAHGGNIWVKSKEGEGTTFGFTLQAFKDVANDQQNDDNDGGITRSAHGWIKNHSLYRR